MTKITTNFSFRLQRLKLVTNILVEHANTAEVFLWDGCSTTSYVLMESNTPTPINYPINLISMPT